jgi:hypothetical protein
MRECERIRRFGGRIILFAAGMHAEQEFLRKLCVADSDYFNTFQAVDISNSLVNLVTEL